MQGRGVRAEEWEAHAAAMKEGLREVGIVASVTDGALAPKEGIPGSH